MRSGTADVGKASSASAAATAARSGSFRIRDGTIGLNPPRVAYGCGTGDRGSTAQGDAIKQADSCQQVPHRIGVSQLVAQSEPLFIWPVVGRVGFRSRPPADYGPATLAPMGRGVKTWRAERSRMWMRPAQRMNPKQTNGPPSRAVASTEDEVRGRTYRTHRRPKRRSDAEPAPCEKNSSDCPWTPGVIWDQRIAAERDAEHLQSPMPVRYGALPRRASRRSASFGRAESAPLKGGVQERAIIER